jgi:hypothetical protein
MAPLADLFAGGLQQLLAYLRLPCYLDWQRAIARYLAYYSLSPELAVSSSEANRILQLWYRSPQAQLPDPHRDADGSWRLLTASLGPHVRLCLAADHNGLMTDLTNDDPNNLCQRLHVVLRFDDRKELRAVAESFTRPWRRFQALDNWLQFLPGSWVGTEENRSKIIPETSPTTETVIAPINEWADLKRHLRPAVIPLFDALANLGLLKPEVGYELLDARQEVIGMAELAWPTATPPLAIIDPDNAEDHDNFTAYGWSVLPWNAVDGVEKIQALLNQGK